MIDRFVHLSPRLDAVLHMLEGADTVADVGCDHGRLTAALLQQGICRHVIASDISKPSLEKARYLISYIKKDDLVSFRLGDGLNVLKPYECDAIAILGMGGTLMCKILEKCDVPLMGARSIVLQPMRAQDDIRSYLYKHKYRIIEDKIVLDHGRYYQIIKAEPGITSDTIPNEFPMEFFDVGYKTFSDRDPLLVNLCEQQLHSHCKMLPSAKGTEGERTLSRKIRALETILSNIKEN